MGLISLGAGVAIGYMLGTDKGRENLGKLRQSAEEKWNDPKVQDTVRKAEETANNVAHDVASRTKEAAAAASDIFKQGMSEPTHTAEQDAPAASSDARESDSAESGSGAETQDAEGSDPDSSSHSPEKPARIESA